MIREKILLVDDEPKVLTSLTRELFEIDCEIILTAHSGEQGLKQLASNPDTAVIVSDFRMPGMSGIDFLARAQQICPDATRMMLTGAADLQTAADAVNQANIFRFMIKPCPADLFIPTIRAGIRQYQLVTSEKVLLSKTLNGSVKVLVDILASLNPELFARINSLRLLARDLSSALKLENPWELELATLLCKLGMVTVPKEILDRWMNGDPLDDDELAIIHSIPQASSALLSNIPRLEKVAESVRWQDCGFSGTPHTPEAPVRENIPITSRVLKVLLDYDWLYYQSFNPYDAYHNLMQNHLDYDPRILAVFGESVIQYEEGRTSQATWVDPELKRISINDLQIGMMIGQSIYDRNSRLIVSRGTFITEALRYRLRNYYRSRLINEMVAIYPRQKGAELL